MTEIRKPAVKIEQGRRTLFLTSFTIRDFQAENFYRIDRLDVGEERGMQRLLNVARAKSFGRDITNANKHGEAFLPTSVFLATEGTIGYDENARELYFNDVPQSNVYPFDVVDGQHRIEGLKDVAKENKDLLDFPISVVIAHEMRNAEKMLQFLIVNTKQQPVDAGVTQVITARFTKMLDVQELPYIPDWLRKQAEKGHDKQAIRIAKKFNEDGRSPWRQKIQFADESRKPHHTIRQNSFVKSIKRVLLTKNHPLSIIGDDEEKRFDILINFWRAVKEICIEDESADTALFKYIGLEFFHLILAPLLNQLARDREYTEEKIKNALLSARDYLSPDAVRVLSSDFWKSGGQASGLNRGALDKLSADFAQALVYRERIIT